MIVYDGDDGRLHGWELIIVRRQLVRQDAMPLGEEIEPLERAVSQAGCRTSRSTPIALA